MNIAFLTKKVAATSFRGTRIKVLWLDPEFREQGLFVTYQHGMTPTENHVGAAEKAASEFVNHLDLMTGQHYKFYRISTTDLPPGSKYDQVHIVRFGF